MRSTTLVPGLLPPLLGEGWGEGTHSTAASSREPLTPTLSTNGRGGEARPTFFLPLPLGEGWGEGTHSHTGQP